MSFSTVQSIISRCSQDIRRILDSSVTADQVALIDYNNRVQLQLLREAHWRFLLSDVLQFETVRGVSDYWIGASGSAPSTVYTLSAAATNPNGGGTAVYTGTNLLTIPEGVSVVVAGFTNANNNGTFIAVGVTNSNIILNNPNAVAETHAGTATITLPDTLLNITNLGTVKPGTVFDRTNSTRLYPTDETPVGPNYAGSALPRLYRNDQNTPGIFSIYPPPQADKYLIEFRFFFATPQLTALGDSLLIPDRYDDVVIAGVNWFASAYLRESLTDAQFWKAVYEEGKQGMKRDHNLFPRGNEFISPDPASQPQNNIVPLGLDSGIETSLP